MGNGWNAKGAEDSTRGLRRAAIPEERFEGFLAGVFVQQTFAFLGIQGCGVELLTSFPQLGEPFFVFRAELLFELLSEALGKGRALSCRGNRDLQCSTFEH